MGILALPLAGRNFYLISSYTCPFLPVYTPRHLLLFDKDIFVFCPLTHMHLYTPSLYRPPAVTSHFILISTSSSSHCIFQPHLLLSKSCHG